MKCHIRWHFIRVYTVCKDLKLKLSSVTVRNTSFYRKFHRNPLKYKMDNNEYHTYCINMWIIHQNEKGYVDRFCGKGYLNNLYHSIFQRYVKTECREVVTQELFTTCTRYISRKYVAFHKQQTTRKYVAFQTNNKKIRSIS